ncbi:hypothetical protein CR513_31654, partial [Mucuna pruriens]
MTLLFNFVPNHVDGEGDKLEWQVDDWPWALRGQSPLSCPSQMAACCLAVSNQNNAQAEPLPDEPQLGLIVILDRPFCLTQMVLAGSHVLSNRCCFPQISLARTSLPRPKHLGMKKSPTMQSSVDWCGISNGATGWSLMLSFITIPKYSNFSKSDSSTFLFIPTTLSNSIWTFFITFGFLSNSETVHSITVAEVSIAPTSISCV